MVIIYHLLAAIDTIIYSLASSMFRIIFDLANTQFFKEEQITTVANRIYVVVGVLMLFKLVISGVQYIINPDVFDDKEKGLGGVLKKTAISIALIVVVPIVFNFLMAVQTPIIKTLPSVILGSSPSQTVNDESIGFDLSFQVLSSFVRVRPGKDGGVGKGQEIHDFGTFNKYVTKGCPAFSLFGIISTDNCVYDYMIIVSTICGGFLCYVLLSMILDIAIRTIKMGIIQILAPIPISSYVFSKDRLNKFVKTVATVYFDLFIRMGIVYFIIFAIQMMIENDLLNVFGLNGGGVADTGDWFRNTIVNIVLIFGLLMFAKNAPKFISELLGLPDIGSGDMAEMFKPAWQRVGGLSAAGAAIGAYRNAKDYGESGKLAMRRALTAGAHATATRLKDVASGKSLSESYKSSKEAAAARTMRNLEYANRYPNRKERQKQIWQERLDKYTGVTTGGKKASGTIAAANTLLEGRSHSWNRAEAKVLEAPGKYTRATTITGSDGRQHTYTASSMLTRMKELEADPTKAAYTGEYQDLVNNRQKILDTAKQEFIEKSFSELSGDGQQRNVFAEDIFKFMRSGGDPKTIGGALEHTFEKKDANGNVIRNAQGEAETVTVNLKNVANTIASGGTLDEYEARAMAEYIATKMNNEGGRMRVQATQTQTSEPKS